MTDSQDDAYSGLAAAIGAEVSALVDDDSPVTPAPDPAAPSSDPAPATDRAPATPEAATPPAADASAPDGAAPDDPDPLDGAEPFTYKVDGEVRTLEGASVIPGVGAVIPHDLLATVQDRLGQADRLRAVNQTQYETIQRFDALGGAEKIRELTVAQKQAEAAAVALYQLLDNPSNADRLAQLLLAETPEARKAQLSSLMREVQLSAREARLAVQDQPATPPIDLTNAETRATVLTNAVEHVATEAAADFPGLTPEDVQFVVKQAKTFHASLLTTATPEEAKQAGVKPGDPIVQLPLLHGLLKDRAEWRAQQQRLATTATATAKENAARLAAAARRTPTKPATPAPQRPAESPAPDEGESWEQIKTRWAGGQFAATAE